MLNVSLTALDRGEVHVREQVQPDDPMWEGAELTLAEPLDVDLTAREVGEGVFVRGRLRTTVRLACRRCLSSVEQPVDDAVDLLYMRLDPEDDEAEGEVYPLPARGDELDLRDAVREQLLLRAPRFALCREECRGLCPSCGADRNHEDCACVPEPASSPWDALKNVTFD
ncbi:YceD family protein [Longimicrobium sp.]|uniref:YceD family protein n=1 Tax=Longimicrobium sp. TaxID=2029185 RepID=UPI003B3B4214